MNKKKLDEFKLLLREFLKQACTLYMKILYIAIPYRLPEKNKTLNKEWIDIFKGLLNRSIEGVEKLKPGGSS